MFKRKSAAISTPPMAGVYRPHADDNAVEMTDSGRNNPAFILEPETDLSSPGVPPAVAPPPADSDRSSSDSSSSGIASIEDSAANTQSGTAAGGSTPRGSRSGPEVVVENEAAAGGKKGQPQLKKSINLLHCTAIMVAVTGHSSIFISPAAILGLSGSIGASLVVWLIGG